MKEIPFFSTPAAFAMRVGQLATTIYDQMDGCLAAQGVKLPGYTTSIVQALFHAGPQSISDLATELQLSHQLASQRVQWLVRRGFVTTASGADDRRVRIVTLTRAGRVEADKLQRFLPRLEAAYGDLFDEVGLDLHDGVVRASAALVDRPLAARFGPVPLAGAAPVTKRGRS
ncbi:MAG: MarR family transcriptional regulator [Gemmatimonadetes bacterium]|nr:MarR family transcriptional regulator [Gemmatimonadota bacterium]